MSIDTEKEKRAGKFLSLAYARFSTLFEELIDEQFYNNDPYYRLSRIRDVFSVYSEILTYKSIGDDIQKSIFTSESEKILQYEIFKVIRHGLSHFPFFDSWDDVWLEKDLVNWNRKSYTIDPTLKKYENLTPIKYSFETENSKEVDITIKFPSNYTENQKIYLKDMLTEKEGVRFSILLMKFALDRNVGKVLRLNE